MSLQLVISKPKSNSVRGDRLVQKLHGPWVDGDLPKEDPVSLEKI